MSKVTIENPFLLSFYKVSISNWPEKKKKLMDLVNWKDVECFHDDFFSDYYKNMRMPDQRPKYVNQFINILNADLNEFVTTLEKSPLNRHKTPLQTRIAALWAQRYRNQQWMPPHTHEPYGFSAVLYADYDPKEHQPTWFISPFKNTVDGMDYNYQPVVKEGDIVFFPSNLMHLSRPHQSKKDRTIFSFNLAVLPAGRN